MKALLICNIVGFAILLVAISAILIIYISAAKAHKKQVRELQQKVDYYIEQLEQRGEVN